MPAGILKRLLAGLFVEKFNDYKCFSDNKEKGLLFQSSLWQRLRFRRRRMSSRENIG